MLAEFFFFQEILRWETQTTISYTARRVVKNASRVLLFSGNTEVETQTTISYTSRRVVKNASRVLLFFQDILRWEIHEQYHIHQGGWKEC